MCQPGGRKRGTGHTPQVKRAIGSSLIEENEALFAEASAYAEILGDVRIDTGKLLARQQLCSNPHKRMVRAPGADRHGGMGDGIGSHGARLAGAWAAKLGRVGQPPAAQADSRPRLLPADLLLP